MSKTYTCSKCGSNEIFFDWGDFWASDWKYGFFLDDNMLGNFGAEKILLCGSCYSNFTKSHIPIKVDIDFRCSHCKHEDSDLDHFYNSDWKYVFFTDDDLLVDKTLEVIMCPICYDIFLSTLIKGTLSYV